MGKKMLDIEYSPPLATLFMDRQNVLNAYNETLLEELKQGFTEILSDDKIDAVILTGRGFKAFTVGADLDWLESLDAETAREISRKGQQICDLIENSSKVVIAAVNGYALGGGMEIALACDLRVASTRARFGQPEVSLGIIPGFNGTWRLPNLIGVGRAKEMLFTGEMIDAEEANEIGLVNRLVTPGDLLKESKDLAHKITRQSSRAVSLIKKVINKGQKKAADAGSNYENEAFSNCFKTEEHLQRIRDYKQSIKSK